MLLAVVAQHLFSSAARAYIVSPNTRWTSTASNSSTGTFGNPITLTWSLVPDETAVSNGYAPMNGTSSNLISAFDATFGAGPGGTDLTQRPWFPLFSDSFKRWGQVGGIDFVYEPQDSTLALGNSTTGAIGVCGDIRIGGTNIDGSSGTFAKTLIPQTGDILIDTADTSNFANSYSNHVLFRNSIMHEIGHAFGLQHVVSDTNDFLMEPTVSWTFDGPQLDDIAAIQYFYGDPNEKSHNMLGNNTAATATPVGTIAAGRSIDIGSSAVGKDSGSSMVVGPGESDFVSIFGNTDADYYSFNVASAVKLNAVLTPRGGTYNQGPQGAAPSPYNANTKNDLTLTVFGPNGTSQVALVNATGAGGSETLSDLTLSPGPYYVRVNGSTANTVQLYDLKLSVDAIPIPGDYNHDGVVDAADYLLWRLTLGQSGNNLAADGNNNRQIDDGDYDVWRARFGSVATIPIPGDYNQDGQVDTADYLLWRLTLGQTGDDLVADGNKNEQIDAGDYEIWRTNFGQSANKSTATISGEFLANVPEPESSRQMLAGAVGFVGSILMRKRRMFVFRPNNECPAA